MTILTDTRWRLALVGLVCLAAVLLLAARLHYGFLPEDDPALSYLGERTLQGGLPNVGAGKSYTGGQSFLNAFAIHLFGARLIAPRIMLLLFFIPWVLAIWYLACRITSAMNALLLTLLAAVWSVPVYPAAFASWYNLYFATGTAALFRYLETRSRRWLFLAGVWGGLSILAKLFGLYFVASLLLFVLFDEQRSSAVADEQRNSDRRAYPIFVTLALATFIAALVKLVSSADRSYGASAVAGRYYHFVLPIAAVSLLLIAREWRGRRAPANVRIIALWKRLVPVSLGVALPVAIFLVPYALRHAVGPWLMNVLLTRGRIQHAANAPASNLLILMTVPLLLLLLANAEWKDRQRRKMLSAGLAVLLGMLLFAAAGHHLAAAMWFSVARVASAAGGGRGSRPAARMSTAVRLRSGFWVYLCCGDIGTGAVPGVGAHLLLLRCVIALSDVDGLGRRDESTRVLNAAIGTGVALLSAIRRHSHISDAVLHCSLR